ncbi:diguanylate cyclase/phosphodiesterase (GGDEF & EAL domain) with PAS/PAC sensor(s) [Rhodopirellula islandica]|uniref:histidine kinase n=2 Tax=Rhodopirellula islandica TaxID=595434 RepID=A0A0J1BGA0_RHOIS|nr:diguanylate cyclase/phosphodiesterase (GGDEF & EAL domain) with PAS/PAC sensor(s) [Rhodopirellula islandica]
MSRSSTTVRCMTRPSIEALNQTPLSDEVQLPGLKVERHSRILEDLLRGESLEITLTKLVELAEESREGMLGSVMLLDSQAKQLQLAASVSLPDRYVKAMDGLEIGPRVGSCGMAACTGERVVIEDLFTHPNWKPYRELVRATGLRACWSEPILSGEGEILGTFGMYYQTPRSPEHDDLILVNECAKLAALAIERHRGEERDRQLAAIVNSTDDVVISKNLNGVIQSWNPAAERIYGYSQGEAIGRSIEMLVPADRRAEQREYQKRLRNGERIEHFSTVRCTRDGQLIDVALTMSPVHDAAGKIVQIVEVQKDMTSSKRSERELRETRRQHSMLLSNLLGAAFRCHIDEDFSIELISEGIEAITGYSADDFRSKKVRWITTVDPRDIGRLRSEIAQAIAERRPYQLKFRIIHRDGSLRWIWEHGQAIYDESGIAIALEGYATDVTDREAATIELRDREQRYRSVIETANSLIVCVSLDHKITEWNSGATRVLGYSRSEALGQNPYQLFVEEASREAVIAEAKRVNQGHPLKGYELSCVTREGERRSILWNATQLIDGEGKAVGHMAVGHDITELKAVQEKLIQSARLAAVGEMVSAIAHESRNALQRIQIGVDMLGFDVPENSEMVKELDRISRAKDDLKQLFEELRSYAAPLKLEFCDCSVAGVWRQTWANLESEWKGRDVTFLDSSQMDGGTSVDVNCDIDPFRMQQVFRNVFENALAACEDPIEISVHCREGDIEGDPALLIQVRDNGPGLAKEQQKQLFDAFFTTKPKGTGLGMAIAKRIMTAHFGTIGVRNNSTGGACVELAIPRKQI